jgi:hypothetical protein
MHIPPELQRPYAKIILAGMKVMFSDTTHGMLIDRLLKGQGDIAQGLGQGAADLMFLLVHESNNGIPPQLIVPAGTELIAHAADFLAQAGHPVSTQDFAQAVATFTKTVLSKVGMDPNKVMAGGQPQQPQGAQPPAAPQQGAVQ